MSCSPFKCSLSSRSSVIHETLALLTSHLIPPRSDVAKSNAHRNCVPVRSHSFWLQQPRPQSGPNAQLDHSSRGEFRSAGLSSLLFFAKGTNRMAIGAVAFFSGPQFAGTDERNSPRSRFRIARLPSSSNEFKCRVQCTLYHLPSSFFDTGSRAGLARCSVAPFLALILRTTLHNSTANEPGLCTSPDRCITYRSRRNKEMR